MHTHVHMSHSEEQKELWTRAPKHTSLLLFHAFPAYMETRCVCKQAAVQGRPQILPLVALARSKHITIKAHITRSKWIVFQKRK
jgi:hypothetical protein